MTTPQDLLADLGSPSSIYYKEEDKMKIHSDTKDNLRSQHQEEDGILGEMDDIGYDRSTRPSEGNMFFIYSAATFGQFDLLNGLFNGHAR